MSLYHSSVDSSNIFLISEIAPVSKKRRQKEPRRGNNVRRSIVRPRRGRGTKFSAFFRCSVLSAHSVFFFCPPLRGRAIGLFRGGSLVRLEHRLVTPGVASSILVLPAENGLPLPFCFAARQRQTFQDIVAAHWLPGSNWAATLSVDLGQTEQSPILGY